MLATTNTSVLLMSSSHQMTKPNLRRAESGQKLIESMKNKAHTKQIVFGTFIVLTMLLSGCCGGVQTPQDTKYLADFHLDNFEQSDKLLESQNLALYVDYSTCTMLGQNSPFFQALEPTFTQLATKYYSIKGSTIKEENLQDSTAYLRLRNIKEVNYAELKQAANQIAAGNCESVLLTDGEYYTKNMAKGHDNDPWLADAFKTWILKGHDIHILSEPYVEGNKFNKKRFYILFTDDRNPNNVYERILRTVDLSLFPEVDEFHISASHPQLRGNGDNSSSQNELLLSRSKGYGTFEIEDWNGCGWDTIEDLLVNACDEQTGIPLDDGAPIIQMGFDKNSFGCYSVESLNLKVYDINQEYASYYEEKANGQEPLLINPLTELENFMEINADEFEKHSIIHIHFKKDWFDPNVLTGEPFNYFKLDLSIGEIASIFGQHEEKFEFESISQQGTKNVSVASSIKQCLADDEVIKKLKGQVIYSIYIKSEQK